MPHLYKKTFKGRSYWYLREVHRVEGKVRVKWQKYLGAPETILARLEATATVEQPVRLKSQPFGALFLAHVLEQELDTIGIIDSVIPRATNERGPSVGEYFFYAWANRMIAPKSKRGLEHWYRKSAIQHIRPVDLGELTSERYWEKWNRVSAEQIEEIGRLFFQKLWSGRLVSPESLLFDTTNYFTYMATKTQSALAVRGHNKSGKRQLRQIGLGLLLDRQSSLPLFYTVYPGNLHDSTLFHQVMDELFGVVFGVSDGGRQVTVVFDKGMNSEENIGLIDSRPSLHFVTTYSPYFAEHLARLAPKHFTALDLPKNRALRDGGREDDLLMAYRTSLPLWGRERTVVVTYNPVTKRKKLYDLARKLERIRAELIEYRRKHRCREPQWRSPKEIVSRYRRLCEELYVSHRYYRLRFAEGAMSFGKDRAAIEAHEATLGKTIIVTDNDHWSTEEIVSASLDRSWIEQQFRVSKAPCHVRVNPIYHWTDSKIRCHLLSCIIALAALRLLELKTGNAHSAKTIMEEMQELDCILSWRSGKKAPESRIEEPNELQAQVLAALGYQVRDGSVLHVAA